MEATLTLYLDPWLMVHADHPGTESARRITNVRFHEHVDYERATVGPGVGFLRMSADEWFAVGAPKVITVTVTPDAEIVAPSLPRPPDITDAECHPADGLLP